MVCFFLSLLKRKLPQRCPKQGGGRSRPLLDNVRKEAAFFSGLLPLGQNISSGREQLDCLFITQILRKHIRGNSGVTTFKSVI